MSQQEWTPPVLAVQHSANERSRGVTAATMLTVYLVLLVAIPSAATISALGGLGRPSVLWGLVMLFWWILSRLQLRNHDAVPVPQPVRFAFVLFVVVVLVSFAAAMLRGQPADQVSPAFTALVRVASWGGVAMDGIRTHADGAKLIRRLTIAGGALAAFGMVQFITGQTLLDWVGGIPGVTLDLEGLITRGAFTRSPGTAIHPLEYGTVVVATLPLAIICAVTRGFRGAKSRAGYLWLPVGVITVAALVAVSRSAIIGLAVAVIASLPAIPKAARWPVIIGGGVVTAGVLVAVPRIFGTLVGLFVGASDDPSTQSRTDALARVPEFISSSPFIGQGFGTFLPRYYIFDNAWVLMTVELGVIGVIAFAGLVGAALWSAAWAGWRSPFEDTAGMSKALAAAMLTMAVLFAFFDGLSFPMSAGYFFLCAGLTGAMRTIAASDLDVTAAMKRAARTI
jgi:polysaccharide biosynthesis protein PslJ